MPSNAKKSTLFAGAFATAKQHSFSKPEAQEEGENTVATESNVVQAVTSTSRKLDGAFYLSTDVLVKNPFQVRSNYDSDAINELAADIKERGILQPLVVRTNSNGDYEIVAGQRRYLAALAIGLKEVPVILKTLDDDQARYTMLVENIQRENLSRLDEKRFFEQLQAEYNLSIGDIARLINKSRKYVHDRLNLVAEVTEDVVESVTDSEKNHEVFQKNKLREKSQSVPREKGEAKFNPNIFKKAEKVLDNALLMFANEGSLAENLKDEKTVEQLRNDVKTLEAKLAELKKHLD